MPVGTSSSGMRQRFNFALLLALDFDMDLTDEWMPQMTDVDFNRKAGRELFDRTKTAATSVVSHRLSTIEKFCNRVATRRDGRLYLFEALDEGKRYYDYTS